MGAEKAAQAQARNDSPVMNLNDILQGVNQGKDEDDSMEDAEKGKETRRDKGRSPWKKKKRKHKKKKTARKARKEARKKKRQRMGKSRKKAMMLVWMWSRTATPQTTAAARVHPLFATGASLRPESPREGRLPSGVLW